MRRHALLIEDEEPIRTLLARLLVWRDYKVAEAASCAQAKTFSDGRAFDLVLCDVRLGDGNGGDGLRHIRAAQPALGPGSSLSQARSPRSRMRRRSSATCQS